MNKRKKERRANPPIDVQIKDPLSKYEERRPTRCNN
jgi:hypothetical protein